MSLEELLQVKVETPSRKSQPKWQSPLAVTIITGQQITGYGYQTVWQALNSVVGSIPGNNGWRTEVGFRGILGSGTFNSRILWMINGHRMNESYFQWAFPDDILGLNMSQIEKIEVARGPGSAMYGSNAFLATVNVVTKSHLQKEGLNISLQTGGLISEPGNFSSDESVGGLSMNKISLSYHEELKNENDYFTLSVSHKQDSGYPLYVPFFTATGRPGIADKDNDILSDKLNFDLGYGDWRLQLLATKNTFGTPLASFGATPESPFNRAKMNHYFLDLANTADLNEDWLWNNRIYFDKSTFSRDWFYQGYWPVDRQQVPAKWYGIESVIKRESEDSSVLFGLEFTQNDTSQSENYPSESVNTFRNYSFYNYSLFSEYDTPIVSDWRINVGLRAENNQNYGWIGTGRVALIYRANQFNVFRVSYGEAFKNILVHDYFYRSSVLNTEQFKIEKLEREKIDSSEFSWTHFFDYGQIELTLFRSKIDNLVKYNSEFDHYFNGKGVNTNGAELQFDFNLSDSWTGYINASAGRSEDLDINNDSLNSPGHSIKLGQLWKLGTTHDVILGLEVQHYGRADYEDNRSLPNIDAKQENYNVANLNLTGTMLKQFAIDWNVSLTNIFNASYMYYPSKGTRQGFPGRGRYLQLGIKFNF